MDVERGHGVIFGAALFAKHIDLVCSQGHPLLLDFHSSYVVVLLASNMHRHRAVIPSGLRSSKQ